MEEQRQKPQQAAIDVPEAREEKEVRYREYAESMREKVQ